MSDTAPLVPVLADAHERLTTVPTLAAFVRDMNIDPILRTADHERFEVLTYDAAPMVRALLCRELAGLSWNGLYEYLSTDARAMRLGFDPAKFGPYNTAPTRQTLTAAWETELSDGAKRAILAVSERLVAITHENEAALDLRRPRHVEANESDLRERHVGEFSDNQIRHTIRLARDTIFGAFDSGRAANATYPESRFDELQGLMSLFDCGSPQGQSRMENFFGTDYTPHGDTHLRTIQKHSEESIQTGFDQSIENLLDAVNHVQILQPPVTAAIDITTWPYHAEDDLPPEVSGTKRTDETAYKFATLSLVGNSMPIVLAFEPVIESSEWDDNPPHRYHRTVRRLVRRAQKFVTIDLILADRGFESWKVYQTLDNLGVQYLLPKIERSPELESIGRMEQDDEAVAVEREDSG